MHCEFNGVTTRLTKLLRTGIDMGSRVLYLSLESTKAIQSRDKRF